MNCSYLVIIIRNSRLLLGCVDKSVLGANGKTNVFYMLLRDCSEAAAALAMARLARLTSYYLSKSCDFLRKISYFLVFSESRFFDWFN
jgi:hypothetical protein